MAELKPCGTLAAYKRHLRYGQEPCDECRAAWNEYQSEYVKRTRSAGGPLTQQKDGGS